MTDYSVPRPFDIAKTGVELKMMDSVPMMVAGDKPFWGFMYTIDPYDTYPYLDCVRSMYAQGVRLFSFLVPLVAAWDKPGPYDFTLIDELHDKMLDVAPEGLFYARVFVTTPHWWDEENPDELIGFRGGRPQAPVSCHEHMPLWKYEVKLYQDMKNASLASGKWRKDASDVLAAYVKRTWEGKYAGHWFGYKIAYGTQGEWSPFAGYNWNRFGSFDVSSPMLAAFRAFLKKKYVNDQCVQDAWREPDVTIATAEPPTKVQLLKNDMGVLKDPRNCQHYADWIELHSSELHGAILHFCRAAKDAAPRPVLTGAFGGYRTQVGCSAYTTHLAETGLSRLIESDAIDILSTPNWYHNREKGICSQAPIASIARKKIFFAENDVKTHLSGPEYPHCGGPGSSLADGLTHFKRDTFYNFTQGSGHLWWYDFGLGWYLDKNIEDVVAKLVEASTKIAPSDRKGQAEVAYVIDEESTCYTEGSSGYYKLSRDCLNEHLPKMGAPFDVITYDDMMEREPYKLYIFRDLFYAPDKKLERTRGFLVENNASAVWIFACGLLGETGIDTRRAEKLVGFRLGLIDTLTSQQLSVMDFSHPITRGVPMTQGSEGNDDIRGVYGPMLYVDDDRADILGQIESIEMPGIAFRKSNDRFDAWFASPLLTYQLLANLAREAGVHLYTEPSVTIYGKGSIFSLQSEKTCAISFTPKHQIQSAYNVLTGEIYQPGDGVISVDLIKDEPTLIRLMNSI